MRRWNKSSSPVPFPRIWKGREIHTDSETLKTTEAFALELRQRATNSEKILWEALRGRRLNGLKFRRQHPFGPFVVDFFCCEKQLVIEVDGPIHDAQAERDLERQKLIEGTGCRVLRFSSEEVEKNLEAVLDAIRNNVQ